MRRNERRRSLTCGSPVPCPGRTSRMSWWSAGDRRAPPRPSRWPVPAATCVLVDKARFPRDKCCGDGLTTGALRLLEAPRPRPGAPCRRGRSSTPRGCARRRARGRASRSPTGRAVRRRRPPAELDAALVDVARAAGVKVHDGHAFDGVDRARRPRRASRSTASARSRAALRRSPPTACGRPCASCSAPAEPATSASGTRSASTSTA